MNKTSSIRILPSEALVIFLLPVVGYYIGYCLNIGYCNVNNIPISLIVIDGSFFSNIAIVFIISIIIIYVFWIYMMVVLKSIIKKNDTPSYIVVQVMIYLILLMLLGYIAIYKSILNNEIKNISIYILISILLIIVSICLFKINQKKKIEIKITNINKEPDNNDKNNYLILKGIMVLLIITFLPIHYGNLLAKNQKEYYIINHNPSEAGIIIYGNRIILKKSEEILSNKSSSILIYEIKDGDNISIIKKENLTTASTL